MQLELVEHLRSDLASAGYGLDAVTALLDEGAEAARHRGVFAPARRAIAQRASAGGATDALATLTRLLLLGEALEASEVDAALPTLGAAGAIVLGLAAAHGPEEASESRLRAALSVNPVRITEGEEWIVISDLDDQLRRGPARPDHVMGVGGATRSLLAQAPTDRVASALDLGTGCGIVALHLTRFADRVVATDISERALELAEANATLNGVRGRIDFRRGDRFAPVADEQFELVLSNPPFVITPRETGAPVYEYRDGGLTGDALARSVVESGPAFLAPGGTLLCLANWESPWGANGLGRVREWIEAAAVGAGPLSAWVIERDRVDPASYAETWVRDGGARPGSDEFERLLGLWLDDFAARRVTAVGLGSVRVRRAEAAAESGVASGIGPGAGTDAGSGAETAAGAGAGSGSETNSATSSEADAGTVVHLDSAAGAIAGHPGDLLQRAFLVGSATAALPPEEILAIRWVLDPEVREEREHQPGEEAPRAIVLATERPIARRVSADTLLAAAVGACDGELTLAQIADALATLLEVDAEAAADALVASVRELTWFGMLAPA
ncbi:DUF7059 domain-containing protein [Leucobacter sp. USHLN153]|uniref:DUF7059 domain-containing protein n=1 Tax=Leucobacter sp. USHLN153 TaxID=3081268 RepID=UPI003017A727